AVRTWLSPMRGATTCDSLARAYGLSGSPLNSFSGRAGASRANAAMQRTPAGPAPATITGSALSGFMQELPCCGWCSASRLQHAYQCEARHRPKAGCFGQVTVCKGETRQEGMRLGPLRSAAGLGAERLGLFRCIRNAFSGCPCTFLVQASKRLAL